MKERWVRRRMASMGLGKAWKMLYFLLTRRTGAARSLLHYGAEVHNDESLRSRR